ncbi:MAG: dihydroorotase [Deltaproteobacteria bacterium]|nr:dihydroorotase [Deltaproteobacteria bacterium]
MKLILTGGRVVDPSLNIDAVLDISIEDGKIAGIGPDIPKEPAKSRKGMQTNVKTIHLGGMIVVPGLIDMHVHLREPGFEYKETIETGSRAAAAGGFTSVACMPNTNPVNDSRSITEFIKKKAALCGLVNVYPIAAVSIGSAGTNLTDFRDLRDAGAVGFSDDGKPVANSALMRRALEYASSISLPVISHCEDTLLSAGGVMNEGFAATELGLQGIPAIAEDVMTVRDIMIAAYTGAAVHIAHVSTAGSVDIIREAKKRGIRVTAETAPHYFTLTEESLREYDTFYKVNPPLRTKEDVAAVKEGLRDDTIDVIASDHAPHAATDKEVEFDLASSGMVGLETSLALSLSLVSDGVLTLPQLIQKMSAWPAKVLNIPKGTLRIGADADITVIDTKKTWTVDRMQFRSRSRNSPFHGRQMTGRAILTIKGGKITYSDNQDNT